MSNMDAPRGFDREKTTSRGLPTSSSTPFTDADRGRSRRGSDREIESIYAKDKGKERERTSSGFPDRSLPAHSRTTSTNSKLGEALTDVWGAAKSATPSASPLIESTRPSQIPSVKAMTPKVEPSKPVTPKVATPKEKTRESSKLGDKSTDPEEPVNTFAPAPPSQIETVSLLLAKTEPSLSLAPAPATLSNNTAPNDTVVGSESQEQKAIEEPQPDTKKTKKGGKGSKLGSKMASTAPTPGAITPSKLPKERSPGNDWAMLSASATDPVTAAFADASTTIHGSIDPPKTSEDSTKQDGGWGIAESTFDSFGASGEQSQDTGKPSFTGTNPFRTNSTTQPENTLLVADTPTADSWNTGDAWRGGGYEAPPANSTTQPENTLLVVETPAADSWNTRDAWGGGGYEAPPDSNTTGKGKKSTGGSPTTGGDRDLGKQDASGNLTAADKNKGKKSTGGSPAVGTGKYGVPNDSATEKSKRKTPTGGSPAAGVGWDLGKSGESTAEDKTMGRSSTGGSLGGWDLGKFNAPGELATEDKDKAKKSAGGSAVMGSGWGSGWGSSEFDGPGESTAKDKAKKSAGGSLTTGGSLGLGTLGGPHENSAMGNDGGLGEFKVFPESTTKDAEKGTTDESSTPVINNWKMDFTLDPAQTAANESSTHGMADLSDTLGLGKSSPALNPKLPSPKTTVDIFTSEPISNLPVSSGNEGPLNHTELGTSTSNKSLPPKITLESSEPVDKVDDTLPTSKSTPVTPAIPAGADAGAAEETEDKDENVGPDGKPLTTKQKTALKKKKEKEAKEKADRELQEQLERELAEEANAFVAGESGDGDWNIVDLDGKKNPAKDGDAGEDKNDDEDEWPSGKKDKKGPKGKKGKDDEEGGDEANGNKRVKKKKGKK
jgi:hypothetical protein